MNLIYSKVTKIIVDPLYNSATFDGKTYSWWGVWVECVDMGGYQEKELIFDTKEEAEEVEVGYKFLH